MIPDQPPPYAVNWTKPAMKQLAEIAMPYRRKLFEACAELAPNPRPGEIKNWKPLKGGLGYRLRVGDYRALYTIDDEQRTVTVYEAEHRKNAYR